MLARILKKLSPLTQPCTHRRRYLTLKKHAAIFAEIRTVFRIEQQKGEAPLNCSSNASALAPESENITEAISSIAQKIRKKAKGSKHSTILTKAADQINKYRNKISNQLKLGSKVYPLPRTNNLCEISFRELKRGLRRSSGKKIFRVYSIIPPLKLCSYKTSTPSNIETLSLSIKIFMNAFPLLNEIRSNLSSLK